jgi:two-component system chemotaxis sensor kinase CheA
VPNYDSSDFRDQFLDDYYAECDEHLGSIRKNLLAIEIQTGEGEIDVSLLDQLFRSFHTIKGISGMVGLAAAEQLAHSIEGVLKLLRQAELSLGVERLDALVNAVSRLEAVISAKRTGETAPGIDDVIAQLQAIAVVDASSASATSSLQLKPKQKGSNTGAAARRTWSVVFTPTSALAGRGININVVRERLQKLGEILRATPQVKGDGEISFEFQLETDADLATFPEWNNDGLVVSPKADETHAATPSTATSVRTSVPAAPGNIVRVDLTKLDDLMRMVGEMVISRARLEDGIKQAKRSLPQNEWRGLWQTSQIISRQLGDLREGVMHIRMVPIGEIFDRMQFVVRDLARESGKRIAIDLVGRETEIDKFLVERMMDPLLHLVRNAVSHGLERPDEREAKSKPLEGKLTLRAMATGENVVIQIVDDGAGIDVDRVADRARSLGLLGAAESLDDAGLLRLICMSGFSTRSSADRESGRGVGMDVVKKTVEALSGSLSMSTQKDAGTIFTIELPLTLAIADAFIVNVSDQTYAVPQTTIREVIEVRPSDVRRLERNEIAPYRESVLPLVRLSKVFNLPETPQAAEKNLHVIVTGTGGNALGIAVDRVVGHREIVVRGITDSLAQVPGIGGATDLGDERVVLILDVAAIRRSMFEGNSNLTVGRS